MKTPILLGALALLVGAASASGQTPPAGNTNLPDALRCATLATIEPTSLSTAIYYIAGYYNARRDLETIAVTGEPPVTAGSTLAAPPQQPQAGVAAAETPVTPVPTLPLEAIVATCSQSPDSRIVDVITAHGGT